MSKQHEKLIKRNTHEKLFNLTYNYIKRKKFYLLILPKMKEKCQYSLFAKIRRIALIHYE
jgi:hypothetical protein